MKKCCIFDFDGTLADTLETLAYFVNKTLNNYNLPKIETEKFKYLAGDGARNLIKRSLKLSLPSWSKEFEDKFFSEYSAAYDADFMKLCKIYEGIPELLTVLKAKNIKLTILTNKPHNIAVKTIETLFGKNTFDIVLGQQENFPIKPDPKGAFQIINELNLIANDCIYIGDTSTDMKTGKNAGIFTVGVLWGFRDGPELEATGADAIISKPAELLKFLGTP